MSGTAFEDFINAMNKFGADKEPFMFIVDFEMNNPEIYKVTSIPPGILFFTQLLSNVPEGQKYSQPASFTKHPVKFSIYSEAFRKVMENIMLGNSYLLNLTFPTLFETKMTLEEIFYSSFAPYKLLYHNNFVVFSPETFVRIKEGVIRSFPMKGTIDASVPDAEKVILKDEKEAAEHNTIVDLIRNDLSKIADNVMVTRYRYIDRIKSGSGELLQVSSEISGSLKKNYEKNLGDIIAALLPAGSVTGAPKRETVRIIKESENVNRDWYTGIFGVFDGKSLDSAVMIRFIEKKSDKFFFRSGGGITNLSDPVKEYDELIAKVYVPVG